MKYLYIDESEDDERFVVGGVLVNSKEELLKSIYTTRKFVSKNKRIPQREKQKILNEMKDYLLSGNLRFVKKHFLQDIVYVRNKKSSNEKRNNAKVLCAYYNKAEKERKKFSQERKQEIYIKCMLKIIETIEQIEDDFQIVYDKIGLDITYDEIGDREGYFHKCLEKNIKKIIPNVVIKSGKSQEIKQLQAADICIGCLRRYLNKDMKELENFEMIKEISKIVNIDRQDTYNKSFDHCKNII